MLDLYLQQAFEKQSGQEKRAELDRLLHQLPTEDLKKIASYGMCDSGGASWIDKFKGTPLFETAISMEQEELQLDMNDLQTRHQSSEKYLMRDAIRLRKRLLELELARSSGVEPPPMPLPEGVPPAEETAAPAATPAAKLAARLRKITDDNRITVKEIPTNPSRKAMPIPKGSKLPWRKAAIGAAAVGGLGLAAYGVHQHQKAKKEQTKEAASPIPFGKMLSGYANKNPITTAMTVGGAAVGALKGSGQYDANGREIPRGLGSRLMGGAVGAAGGFAAGNAGSIASRAHDLSKMQRNAGKSPLELLRHSAGTQLHQTAGHFGHGKHQGVLGAVGAIRGAPAPVTQPPAV